MVIRFAPASGERPSRPRASAGPPVAAPSSRPSAAFPGAGLLRSLLIRLPAMVLVAALPLAAAFAWLQLQPPRYEATASVFVDAASGRPSRASGGADPAVLDRYVRLATARPVLEKAMAQGRLAGDAAIQTRPTGSAALVAMVVNALGGTARPGEDRAAAILRLLGDEVRAAPAREANLIEITAASPDATTAARFANAVAGALVEEVTTTSTRALGADQVRLVRTGDELKARLREAEDRLARHRASGAGADPAQDLGRVRLQASEAKARYDQVVRLLQGGKQVEAIADLVRSPAIDRLRIQYNEAAAQEATFRTSLGPRHPSYIEAQAQLNEKRRLLMEALRLAAAAARADWQSAQGQEQALEKRLAPDAGGDVQPQERNRTDELERAVELARIAYDRHLRAMGSSEAAMEGIPARIIAAAVAPAAPVSVSSGRMLTGAAALGAALAALVGLLGVLKDRRAAGTYRPSLRAEAPDLPPSGMPPPAAAAAAAAVRPPPAVPSAEPAPFAPPPAPVAVDAAALAAEMAGQVARMPLQTVLVAADSAADVASLALDIATAAAEANLRVLLIDAGEASPVLSEVLRHAILTGRVRIHGRSRVLASFEVTPARPIWFVPAESALASLPPEGGRDVAGLSGNFECVVIAGPPGRGGAGQRALAKAAQVVAVMTAGDPDIAGWSGSLQVPAGCLRAVAMSSGGATGAGGRRLSGAE